MNRFNLAKAQFETNEEKLSFGKLSLEHEAFINLILTIEKEAMPLEFVDDAKRSLEKLFGRELFISRPLERKGL